MEPALKRTTFQKFYAVFLIVAIICPIYYIFVYHELIFSSFSVQHILFIVCFLFYFFSGIKYWQNANDHLNILFVEISLLMQSIHFNIYGIIFYSNYGPYTELGFSDLFKLKLQFEFGINIMQFSVSFVNSEKISLLFNLVTVILYVIFIRQVRRNKSEELLKIFK